VSLAPEQIAELHDLLWGLRAGTAVSEELSRLERLVCDNAEARKFYVRYMHLCADLHWNNAAVGKSEIRDPVSEGVSSPSSAAAPWHIPPIVIDTSPAVHPSLAATLFTPGGFLFSYTMSAVLLAIALATCWAWRVSSHQSNAPNVARSAVDEEAAIAAGRGLLPADKLASARSARPVGRITGLADCRWTDPKTEVSDGDYVRLGQEYALASGMMEITYDTGAKVILQGQVTYTVESARGGYLALGKLTARVEKKDSEAKGERTANPTLAQDGSAPTASLALRPSSSATANSQLSTLDSRLFSVRTPTAIVTDLGTEFGVEVERSGASHAHVFRGKVELRSALGDSGKQPVIRLGENESGRVERGADQVITATRDTRSSDAREFVRRLPQRAPFKLFNTGAGLKAGEPDPHWQVVAVSNDPNFKPRPAVVAGDRGHANAPAHDLARSQWISIAGDASDQSGRVAYTFRTTFELAEPAREVMLRGRLMADGGVRAIRVNGRFVPLPARLRREGAIEPFVFAFRGSLRQKSFVEGTNVLEIDLWNREMHEPSDHAVFLRMELEGAFAGRNPSAGAEKKPAATPLPPESKISNTREKEAASMK
jgi:hypothetical protein